MNEKASGSSGALAGLPEWLTGAAIATTPTPVMRAAQLREVVELLRVHNTPAALHVASAFDTWLIEGGDLLKMLGLRPGRGGSTQTPQRAERDAIRNEGLRRIDAAIKGGAKAVHQFVLDSKHPAVNVFRENCGLPSVRQIERVLRSQPDK